MAYLEDTYVSFKTNGSEDFLYNDGCMETWLVEDDEDEDEFYDESDDEFDDEFDDDESASWLAAQIEDCLEGLQSASTVAEAVEVFDDALYYDEDEPSGVAARKLRLAIDKAFKRAESGELKSIDFVTIYTSSVEFVYENLTYDFETKRGGYYKNNSEGDCLHLVDVEAHYDWSVESEEEVEAAIKDMGIKRNMSNSIVPGILRSQNWPKAESIQLP